MNPETVRDKDGISAAIAILGMAAEARGRGASLADLITEFGETFGHFASDQIAIRVDDVSTISRIMSALREQHPSSIGDVAVERIDDLLEGVDDLPPGDVLRLWLVDGSRVIVRPSGTEPKLKLYLDVARRLRRGCGTAHQRAHRRRARNAGRDRLTPASEKFSLAIYRECRGFCYCRNRDISRLATATTPRPRTEERHMTAPRSDQHPARPLTPRPPTRPAGCARSSCS